MKKIFLCTIALLALFFAYSQDGTLDPSFAGKGWTTTEFTKGNFYTDYGRQVLLQSNGTYMVVFETNGYSVLARYLTKNNTLDTRYGIDGFSVPVKLQFVRAAQQNDGKVVVAGLYNVTGNLDFGVARFNIDGSLDNSFGVNGLQTTDFFGSDDWPYDVAIQTNGTIIVAGQSYNPGSSSYDFGLAAYTTNGILDASFGTGGLQTTDFYGDMDIASAIAIQTDGKMVVAGQAYNTGGTSFDFAIARYNTDGSPDGGFGVNGKLTTDFFNYGDYAFAIAIQSDSKIVVAGQASDNPNNNDDFALARYNTDGSLDASFGVDGKQTTDFFNGGYDRALALAIQTDGKIIAGGQVGNNATFNIDFGLARYTTDGDLDASFGTGGKQTTDFFSGDQDLVYALAIQSDGKIVALGEAYNSSSRNSDFALARYNTNGSLDNRFDRDGKLTGYYAAGAGNFTAIAVQSDGKIVAAGQAYNSSYNSDFSVARFNTDGSLDRSFNRTGKQTTDFSGNDDYAYALAIQADGKIVVAGSSSMPNPFDPESYLSDFAMARYNANGSVDNKFNRTGKQTTDFFGNIDAAYSIAIQSDGKIVLAGRTYNTNGTRDDFGLARYNTNGSLDGTFGTDGKQTTDFSGNEDYAYALAIQSDGKIVVAGMSFDITMAYDFALARYTTNGTLDGDFDGDGRQTADFFGSYDIGHAIAIQGDKIVVAGEVYNTNGTSYDFALARFNTIDGSLDGSFGDNGKQTIDFLEGEDYAYAMALQSDNKIVVAGGVFNSANGNDDFGLARYTADGLLDVSFDADGKQTSAFSGSYDDAYAVAILGNELYVAGSTRGPVDRGVVAAYSLGTIAPSAPAITRLPAKQQGSVLTVKAMPNPFTTDFTLLLQSVNNSPATISITNAAGQVIERKTNIAANSILQLGANYKPGIYYVEVVQGTEKAVVKLIKQ